MKRLFMLMISVTLLSGIESPAVDIGLEFEAIQKPTISVNLRINELSVVSRRSIFKTL